MKVTPDILSEYEGKMCGQHIRRIFSQYNVEVEGISFYQWQDDFNIKSIIARVDIGITAPEERSKLEMGLFEMDVCYYFERTTQRFYTLNINILYLGLTENN